MTQEEFEELLVKVIDDAATENERQQLMQSMVDRPQWRQEFDSHMSIAAGFENIRSRLHFDDEIDRSARQPQRLFEERLGTGLLILGTGFLAGMGFFEFVVDTDAPMWLKLGLSVSFSGALLLLFSTWRTRRDLASSDPYKKVIR